MVSFKDPRPLGPRRLETWIVLELCGLGSLQVRHRRAGLSAYPQGWCSEVNSPLARGRDMAGD